MKITVSSLGKFTLFYLAQELERKGHLEKLLTSLYSGKSPWVRLIRNDPERISPRRCRVFPVVELFRAARYLPGADSIMRMELAQADAFDAWASGRLGREDVVVARSIVAERTLRRARELGKKGLVFRGSAHIQTQFELLEVEHRKFGLPLRLNRRLMEKELREYDIADAILVLSSSSKISFLERGVGKDRVTIATPGVDQGKFYPEPRMPTTRVLFAGGVGLQKGIPYLLQATRRLRLKKEEVVLAGAMEPGMEEWLRKSGAECTHVPPCSQDRLRELYQSSDVFVLPSIQDGFGVVMLEAMACGCPVVATTHTGGPDVITNGRNGFLVPPRDSEALADAIDRILSDQERRKRMRHNALRTAARYSWARSADQVVAACKRLLEPGD